MSFLKFLYFTKSEKLSISILLSFIVVLGVVYIATSSDTTDGNIDDYMDDPDFIAFQTSLIDIDTDTASIQHKRFKTNGSIYLYSKQMKFKAGETLELNEADTTRFKMIPGIGSSFAYRIVKYREILGGYNSINQLKEVWGMDDYLFESIRPYIDLKILPRRIQVNKASFEELNIHPYINYKQACIIVDIRDRKGDIESIERLGLLEEFSQQDILRLKPYLSFD